MNVTRSAPVPVFVPVTVVIESREELLAIEAACRQHHTNPHMADTHRDVTLALQGQLQLWR